MAVPTWLDPRCRCGVVEARAHGIERYWHQWGCPIRTFNTTRFAVTLTATVLASLLVGAVMSGTIPRRISDLAVLVILVAPFWVPAAVSWRRRDRFAPLPGAPF